MTKLSEAAQSGGSVKARVASEAGTVSDVTLPTWRQKRTLGATKKKG